MKKLFVISIMLVATVAFATAQQRPNMTPEERTKAQVERVEKLLSLTADQKTKIQAIETELGKEMSAIREKNQGDRDAMRTAMQELDKKRDAKYKEVLTADQFKKYLEDKEQRQRERGQGQGQRPERRNN